MPELSWNLNLLKREENNYFAKQEISRLLMAPEALLTSSWKPDINLYLTLVNTVHILSPRFFKVHINVMHDFRLPPRSS